MIDTEQIVKKILDEIIIYFMYGAGLFAVLRAHLFLNGMKIYSIIRILLNKKKFFDHEVFSLIREVLSYRTEISKIKEIPRKHLANKIIYVEMIKIDRTLIQSLTQIVNHNFFYFIKNYNNIDASYIIKIFLTNYKRNEEKYIEILRRHLTKNNDMSNEDFYRFIDIYNEYFSIIEIFLVESLESLSTRKNLFACLFNVLDTFKTLVEIINKTVSHSIQIMNGRVSNIKYKHEYL